MNLQFGFYDNGARAITIFCESGEPFMKVTINLPDSGYRLKRSEIFVKSWSENSPYIPQLLASGLFEDTGKRVAVGFCDALVWKLK